MIAVFVKSLVCIVDCTVNKEIATHKGYKNEVARDVDILVAPNIHVRNIMTKMLTCISEAKAAGIIVGAKRPIVLASANT